MDQVNKKYFVVDRIEEGEEYSGDKFKMREFDSLRKAVSWMFKQGLVSKRIVREVDYEVIEENGG